MKKITRNRRLWFFSIFVLLLLSSCVEDKELDNAHLKFDNKNIFIMNLSLGFIMFGVALQLKIDDFKRVFSAPKSVLIGFVSQFIALPFLTFLIVWIFKPMPSVAMGMMIVAACPGGNISNFMTSLANGNTALSVCMTAIASVCAVFMTPLNISFYGGFYPPTAAILEDVNVDFFDMLEILGMILLIPLVMGMTVRYYKPKVADLLNKFTHYGSMIIFGLIIVFAFITNMDLFLKYIHLVIFVVFAHNAIGIFTGFGLARLFNFPLKTRKLSLSRQEFKILVWG